MRRETLAYWLFVIVGFAQLGALVLIGDSDISTRGVIPVLIMIAWLGRRSRTAWWIFLLVNACEFLMTFAVVLGSVGAGSSGSGTDWGDVVTILLGSSALVAILVSQPMRAWTSSPRVV